MRQDHIGLVPRSLLLRNIAFICEMAGATPWNVVNLVSSTQAIGKNDERKSFADPTEEVRGYLHPDWQNCFTYRTWEMLCAKFIQEDADLAALDVYRRERAPSSSIRTKR
ncbi:MAG: hypothetical protein ABI349_15720 [Casimicrobiaceae bacterium]